MPAKTGPKQDTRFKAGKSGNPKGRPEGSRNKASLLAEELIGDQAEQVVQAIIEAALGGDVSAQRALLDRLCPPSRSRTVKLDLPTLDSTESITEAHTRVVEALAAGELDPDAAATVIGVLTRTRESFELTNIEARLAALEAKTETRR